MPTWEGPSWKDLKAAFWENVGWREGRVAVNLDKGPGQSAKGPSKRGWSRASGALGEQGGGQHPYMLVHLHTGTAGYGFGKKRKWWLVEMAEERSICLIGSMRNTGQGSYLTGVLRRLQDHFRIRRDD